MGEDLTVFCYEKVCDRRVALELMIQQILKRHQIVDQDFIGRFQSHSLGQIFSLSDCRFMPAVAEAMG